ncbi:MAG: nicotinate-nucleotide adenylyltransferase [Lachnospiraceae bacterium]|nr:nicotinate-nucleotide adenylyltransferase [Lachnospiraceae bacterium]
MARRIGILGGTFNPIHTGHMILAEQAHAQFGLDKVYFMPNNNAHHKDNTGIADDDDRIIMTREAIKNVPYFDILTVEMERSGKSYTADTLAILHERYPEDEFYFILGGDSLFQIELWYRPERVLAQAVILAAARDKGVYDDLDAQIALLSGKYDCDIRKLDAPLIDISSTDIRERIRSGGSVRYLVPDAVIQYIHDKGLYL